MDGWVCVDVEAFIRAREGSLRVGGSLEALKEVKECAATRVVSTQEAASHY